jgi:regulatory protein
MNDIVSLDSVRRGRQRHPAGGGGRASAVPEAADGPEVERVENVAAFSAKSSLSAVDHSAEEELAGPPMSDEERLAGISDTVVRALGRRQLSAGETHELLLAQGASPDEAEVLVARYEELGYLNDVALAEVLVERLSERNHKSRGVIARELSARKIPGQIVTEALGQLDDAHEFDLALDAATKRIGQLSSYDDQTAERRLVGFLTRRGFASGVVREATRRAMAGRKSSSGPRFR